MDDGSTPWLLEQSKGYVIAFALSVVTIGPLVLFGAIDQKWLVLPAALAITSAFVAAMFLAHRRLTKRRQRHDRG